jgi:hypothetical protein
MYPQVKNIITFKTKKIVKYKENKHCAKTNVIYFKEFLIISLSLELYGTCIGRLSTKMI